MEELVSICMLAYNHEKWIGNAIQCVINQQCNFKYRLYIHDDMSTDNTRNIVLQYANKYPEIIKVVLADENRYSKGVKIISEILVPITRGKYIALCEGDDCWIDCNKLQKQIDYLESHPQCTLSFSNADIINLEGNRIGVFFPQHVWNDKDINRKISLGKESDFCVEEMIILDFAPTASLVFKKEIYESIKNFKHTLDLLTRLVATSYGYAHYHPECFVAYRTGNTNSASGSIQKSKTKLKENFYNLHCSILTEFDQFTMGKYHNTIVKEMQRKRLLYELKGGNLLYVLTSRDIKDLNKIYLFKSIARRYFFRGFIILRNAVRSINFKNTNIRN